MELLLVHADDMESISMKEIKIYGSASKYQDQQYWTFTGELLGSGNTRKTVHSHEPGVVPTTWCGMCRWTEVNIYQSYADTPQGMAYGQYVIYRKTHSVTEDKPGIVNFADTAEEVFSRLSMKSREYVTPIPHLPEVSYKALMSAGETDDTIREVMETFEDMRRREYHEMKAVQD